MKKAKVLGLIMEINPMHNGHKYFIEKAKSLVGATYTVCVISPSFTMRADTIITKKYDRCKMLLESGVDVVCEIPTIYEVNSSDFFAKSAIEILKKFNVTDICFGVENTNISDFDNLIDILNQESFNEIVKTNLKKGLSYSSSINKALIEIDKPHLAQLNSSPNNILALAYLKNIKSTNINSHLIQRINNNYYDESLNSSLIQSATSLRCQLENGNDISTYVPKFSFDVKYYDINKINERLLLLLKYKLQLTEKERLKEIHDLSEGIESRLISFSGEKSLDSFINSVITKRYSVNKVKRLIFNIVSENVNNINSTSDITTTYIRVLGFTTNGKKLISKLDKEVKSLIISNLKVLNDEKYKNDLALNFEYKVIKLYDLLVDDSTISDEYLFPIRIEGQNG